MGDSRSWAADMEKETKTCQFGNTVPYFDICQCKGCQDVRDFNFAVRQKVRSLEPILWDVFKNTPQEDWDKIVSIRIK